ncbi:MAG: hypothetical protein IKP73_08365 [Bacteroidales bacterium]|nr:hypothetical protein [Bacteroidales bacterium]
MSIEKKHKADIFKRTYTVNSVGDANCIYIDKTKVSPCHNGFSRLANQYYDSKRSYLIDFGYSSKAYFTDNVKQLACNADEFLLSHYHLDHYKGLEHISDNSLLIEKLYYPYIPEIKDDPEIHDKIRNVVHFMVAIDTKLNAGSMGLGLISLLMRKNLFADFDYTPVFKGMSVFDGEYEVIWPPKELDYNDKTTKSLKTGIDRIEAALNKESEIKKMWVSFNREINSNSGKKQLQLFEDDFERKYYAIIKNYNIDLTKYKKVINTLRETVRDVTNRFSVCLFKKGEFLFLGDLEKPELKACITDLAVKHYGKLKVKYLITPHHGTTNHYWSDIANYVEAEYVISSNGERGFEKYAEQYRELASIEDYCTNDGTFDSRTLNSNEQ